MRLMVGSHPQLLATWAFPQGSSRDDSWLHQSEKPGECKREGVGEASKTEVTVFYNRVLEVTSHFPDALEAATVPSPCSRGGDHTGVRVEGKGSLMPSPRSAPRPVLIWLKHFTCSSIDDREVLAHIALRESVCTRRMCNAGFPSGTTGNRHTVKGV